MDDEETFQSMPKDLLRAHFGCALMFHDFEDFRYNLLKFDVLWTFLSSDVTFYECKFSRVL